MLYPAQLYIDELNKRMISCWYNEKYKYYFSGVYTGCNIPKDTEYRRDFVHLDSNGCVDGYFSFHYNDGTRSMTNFGLIGFANNNTELIYDAVSEVKRMFKHGAQRAEFWAFVSNPANKIYERIARKYGGKKVGYLTRTAFFDGEYHDAVLYEFLVENLGIIEEG